MSAVSRVIASLLAGSALVFAASAHATPFQQTNLVTDSKDYLANQTSYSPALFEDPNLINPWGISHSPTSPNWVSDNGTGLATLYNAGGTPQGLVVTIPPAGNSAPTGQVFNSSPSGFPVNGLKSTFIFATENGTIAAWRGTLTPNTLAVTVVNNSASGAVYKGLAIGTTDGTQFFLYAANFSQGRIDVFDSSFMPTTLAGNFTDTDATTPLPAGYAPFNVQVLADGHLYVTYALQDPMATAEDLPGAGHGFVDEFGLDGTFIRRVVSDTVLNSPWGLDIAPAVFGEFSNDLLVGNFGDGIINVFLPSTGAFLGSISDYLGNPIVIDGLWGLINGSNGTNPNIVYFAAGIGDEEHGLFGSLSVVPEPSTLALFGFGLLGLGLVRRRRVQATK